MSNISMIAKKSLLAAGVVVVFVAYSLTLRNHNANSVIAPASARTNTSSGPSGSNSATTNSTSSGSSGSGATTTATYKDGTYTGSIADAFYGNVQIQATISGGKITDVQFLQYPNDSPNSQSINSQAMPFLKQEAIQAQNAQVDGVTGATDTSQAFVQSLSAALAKAQS